MAKRSGPKRQNRIRTASGRLSRSNKAKAVLAQQNMAVALAQPHRAWLPKGARLDQLAESEIGRLHLAGKISEHELAAGQNYQRLVMAYRMTISAPACGTTALGQMVGDAFANCDVSSEPEADRKARVGRQYDAARAALHRLPEGARIAAVVGRVVVHDQPVEGDLAALQAGLAALADLWRMTPREEQQGPATVTFWHAPASPI